MVKKSSKYLTEQKLVSILGDVFKTKIETQVKYGGRQIDALVRLPFSNCKVSQIEDAILSSENESEVQMDDLEIEMYFEYDGHYHYISNYAYFNDNEPDGNWLIEGYTEYMLRIPYWLQLDNRMCKFWFGLDVDYSEGFQQGFVSDKVILPDVFSSMGEYRFLNELNSIPQDVAIEVFESLVTKATKYNCVEKVCSPYLWFRLLAKFLGLSKDFFQSDHLCIQPPFVKYNLILNFLHKYIQLDW